MRNLITLLPFLAAPLLLPPLNSGLQMLGILLLLITGFIQLLPSQHHQNIWLTRLEMVSVAASTVLILFLWFLFPDSWMFHSLYPIILTGWMLLALLLIQQPTPLHAIAALSISGWGMLVYFNANARAIPSQYAYHQWNGLFASIINPPVAPIVSFPELPVLLHWQWMAMVSGFVFLMTAFFQPAFQQNRTYSFFVGLLLAIYCIFFINVMGNFVFWVITLSTGSFIIFYLYPAGYITIKNVWKWIALLLFLMAGSMGWLDFLLMQFSQFLFLIPIPLMTPTALPGTPLPLTLSNSVSSPVWQLADWVSFAAILGLLIGFSQVVYNRFRHPSQIAAYVALAVSILLILPLSPLQWISHPVLWLCLGGFLFSPIESSEPLDEESTLEELDKSNWLELDYRSLASIGVMGLLAIVILNTERRADSNLFDLFQLTQNDDRIAAAEQAHLKSYYRPDIRSIYLTWEINRIVNQSETVPDGKLVELEIASQMCSRNGFIPYLAIKRISDFYTLQGNSSRALSSVEDVIAQHPQDSILHEILAERLFEFGKYQEALDHYRICANESPTEVRIYEKIALAHKSLGDEEEYQSAVQIIHTLNPTKMIK